MNWKILPLVIAILAMGSRAAFADDHPIVIGRGAGLFKVGEVLAKNDLENLNNWEVQIQQRSGFPPAKVTARGHAFDCLLPGIGCTVWFKQKLSTHVTIAYDVLCPTPQPAIKGAQPRDINNFWMANDPMVRNEGLFDPQRYNENFSSYEKIHGYYASTGGGGAIANLTT
ncbi:DUF6250 domain-containing protein [Rubripirellula reticaptiva]|uniref:DUF6250 domain-containing protein n=1 Tax=Rubripirellula reticaptiva TaxID=2528013 RepID=A0A5C6FCP0_9BACT|nr:DUF6250 domain-containing protein [Rubripirellula reticaptiva]TWU58390.1 hypothetical protein Poly59_13010 [Rubripirellula reticaptiva]